MKSNLIMMFLVTGLLSACRPADVHVKTVKERLEAGELVEFTKPGYRRPSCTARKPDWTELRLGSEDERERMVLTTQISTLNPGKESCFRVGSTIILESPDNKGVDAGTARIDKLGLIRFENLQSFHLKGSYFKASEEFSDYKNQFRNKLNADDQGIVTIVTVTYLPGSAVDEKAIRDRDQEKSNSDGYEETTQDGQSLSEGKPWMDMVVAPEFQTRILDGQLGSWFNLGRTNRLAQGQVAQVRSGAGEKFPVMGKVRIKKIKRFRLSFLAPTYFNLGEADFESVRQEILRQKSTRDEEWMTVMDIEPAVTSGERR